MNTSAAILTRRQQLALGAATVAPLAIFVAARLFGFLKYFKLAGLAACAVAVATTFFLRPRWGLAFIIVYVYAGFGIFLPFNVAGLLAPLIAAAVLLDIIRGVERQRNLDGWFVGAASLFLLICLQSMLVARNPVLSLIELSNFGKILLIIWLIVQLVRTAEDLRTLAFMVFIGAVGTVGLGVASLMLGIGPSTENAIGSTMLRFSGGHENANRAAAYMCAALPLGLFIVKNGAHTWQRVACVVGVIVLIVGIFATFSRSVIVPFSFMMVLIVAREVRGRRSWIFLVALLTLGILLAPRYYWDRVFGLKDALENTSVDWSVYTRMLALKTAWKMFLENPLTGIGLNNFIESASHTLFLRIVVHNTYLEILVGTGIFGLTAFLVTIGSGLRHAFHGMRTTWRSQPEWMRSLSFYCLLSGLSILMSAFFGTMPFRYPIWVPVAMGLVVGNLLRAERPAPAPAA